jgi:hypothetical protein
MPLPSFTGGNGDLLILFLDLNDKPPTEANVVKFDTGDIFSSRPGWSQELSMDNFVVLREQPETKDGGKQRDP